MIKSKKLTKNSLSSGILIKILIIRIKLLKNLEIFQRHMRFSVMRRKRKSMIFMDLMDQNSLQPLQLNSTSRTLTISSKCFLVQEVLKANLTTAFLAIFLNLIVDQLLAIHQELTQVFLLQGVLELPIFDMPSHQRQAELHIEQAQVIAEHFTLQVQGHLMELLKIRHIIQHMQNMLMEGQEEDSPVELAQIQQNLKMKNFHLKDRNSQKFNKLLVNTRNLILIFRNGT